MAATRVTVVRDGASVPVDVADDLARVTISGRTFDVKILEEERGRVQLEVAGVPVNVGAWPAGCPRPPGPVEVNGENWTAEIEASGSRGGPSAALFGSASRAPASRTAAPSGGAAVVPPMPGRIVEVRVAEGAEVAQGAVLLVLEAMKMRNEVLAPVAGTVRGLAVREGSNVRARETMLRIEPTTG